FTCHSIVSFFFCWPGVLRGLHPFPTRRSSDLVQGELAGNYAGPFNSNTKVHHINFKATPAENFSVGLLAYRFSSLNKSIGRLDGYEIDLYAEWIVDRFYVMPAIGWYKPRYDSANGGSQIGTTKGNLWGMLLVTYTF